MPGRGISSNAAAVFLRMAARPEAVRRELETAARRLAPRLNRAAKKILNRRIYSKEIPFKKSTSAKTRAQQAGTSKQTKGGKATRLWRRTGELLRRERALADGMAVVMVNDVAYAVPRYMLGTAEGRDIRSAGVESVQWHAEALVEEREAVLDERRQAVLRALKR